MALGSRPNAMHRFLRLRFLSRHKFAGPSLTGLAPTLAFVSAAIVSAALLFFAPAAHAQFGAPPTTPVHDASALKPPPGARVAIVEFYDLECPDCARANPLLIQAAAKYNLPWVRHDFPLPMHNWSFQAAVNARFFDTKSKTLGNDYRDQVFANQPSIETPDELQQFTQRFASGHGVALPFAIDPMGRLTQLVKDDQALGNRIGIEHTPTIWIVATAPGAPPYVEVVDRGRLFQLIDQALAETRGH
jgi:protein-disulfide isomerase